MSLNVGILSIQGDVQENLISTRAALNELGIDGKVTDVKTPEEISQLDGLIIPGGESTGKTDQPLLDILDIKLERNSFGRQKESFEADISMDSINIPKFNGVFIRAPSVSDVGSDIEVLSKFNDRIVAVKKDNVIGTAFHPELTKDISLHKFFVNLVNSTKT